MFHKPPPAVDPDEVMRGTCATCGLSVILSRWQATPPRRTGAASGGPDPFGDLWHTGCPDCGATVYLVPSPAGGG
jgi:hypothetical protein